jgi:hypothetical protein
MMELDAEINYRNARACFKIHKESAGIYYANLIHFDGDKKLAPPPKITMIKSLRQWTGSHNDLELLNALGKIIEESQNASSKSFLF